MHLKNNGGLKKAVMNIYNRHLDYNFVFRSDIFSYYASIDHHILWTSLDRFIHDPFIFRLIISYCQRVLITENGYRHVLVRGIPKGCALSPLIGAWYLKPLDDAIAKIQGAYYVRYMDDWIILSHTKAVHRQGIKKTYAILENIKLKKHPDKTNISRTHVPFDFLGYHIKKNKLFLSTQTLDRFYQNLDKFKSAAEAKEYIKRWKIWASAGVGGALVWPDDIDV